MKEMGNRELDILFNKRYSKPNITKRIIEDIENYPELYNGSVRTAIGNIYTDQEYNQLYKKFILFKLP